ncbi:MAG: heme ABC exporter ATP-binding protein CcmA [Alphaproteobacteria bacterium]|nr:heme ABC exporter ATP-binding protein CcmA [Alphaproteobacteria bacterium]
MSESKQPSTHLDVSGLSARRGGRTIFEGLSFSLINGTSLMVTGPNGSGKSTLLRILAGLLRSEAGTITLTPEDGAEICYAGHRDGLKGGLTVEENLGFWAKLYGANQEAVEQAIDRMALETVLDMPADMLSAGWRRRAGLARLALGTAPIWVLDEPYTALDAENVVRIDGVLNDHVNAGGIVVLATHQAPGFTPSNQINMANYPAKTSEVDW